MIQRLETIILRVLWEFAEPKSQEAIVLATGELAADIIVALEDMAGRGLVALENSSYHPLLTCSEYCAAEIRWLFGQLYSGDAVAFLSDYIDAAGPEDRTALGVALTKRNRQS